jgi:hypothetical protein
MDKVDFSKIPTTLDVSLFGETEKITDTLSKCRVRIFYKGMNRNRTYISEDFANQLIASLPYTPIKGIFDKDTLDYEGHGEDNTDGRIYGVVMADPNFAWEDYEDIDGITRSYACADVLLFTGLYPEAQLIKGKSQSMEIFRKTLVGEWRICETDNQPYYHFISGSLVGLQALGDDTEPCFEGSAFFSLYKDVKEMVDYIKNFSIKKEEKVIMDKSLFRLSDHEKANILFDLLNPNFTAEGNWECSLEILDVYDEYCVCFDVAARKYVRVYYTKDDATDSVVIGDIVDVKIVDVSETEYNALEAMKAVGGSFEATQSAYEELKVEKEAFSTKIDELKAKVSAAAAKTEEAVETVEVSETVENVEPVVEASLTESGESAETGESAEIAGILLTVESTVDYEALVSEKDTIISELEEKVSDFESEKVRLESEVNDLTNEVEKLSAFKKDVETEQKKEILSKYESHLTESAISNFTDNMDKFTVEDFKKEVCTAAVESDPSIFSKEEPQVFYKGGNIEANKGENSLIRLLNSYKNGGNK